MDHDRVAVGDRVGAVAEVVRGHALQHHGRGGGQFHAIGHGHGCGGRDQDLLGVAPGHTGPGHPVARGEAIHV
jgi:hypothetical protein